MRTRRGLGPVRRGSGRGRSTRLGLGMAVLGVGMAAAPGTGPQQAEAQARVPAEIATPVPAGVPARVPERIPPEAAGARPGGPSTPRAAPRSDATDTVPSLGLLEVVESALRTHPSVEGAEARVAALEAAAGQARAAWLPTLSTSAVLTRYQEPMVVAPLHGFDPREPPAFDETLYQGHASAEYTLYDGGARSARIRAAERLANVAEAGAAGARDAVVVDAVSSYLAVLSAEEVRASHAQRVAALETERSRASQLFEQGKAPRVSVLRTEAALSRARAELATTAERVELARRRLARVSGLPPERVGASALAEVAPVESAVPSRAALVAQAVASNPRVRQAERQHAAAEARVAAARAAYLPRVALSGRYSAYGSVSTDPQPEWNAGVQVSYPVFTGGARTEAVGQARAEATAAGADARLAEREAADAVDRGLLALTSARARVAALEAAVSQSAEVARIEALALNAGAGVQTDYLAAEAALLEARAALAEARYAVVEARVRLAQAAGELTVAWLERTIEVER